MCYLPHATKPKVFGTIGLTVDFSIDTILRKQTSGMVRKSRPLWRHLCHDSFKIATEILSWFATESQYLYNNIKPKVLQKAIM